MSLSKQLLLSMIVIIVCVSLLIGVFAFRLACNTIMDAEEEIVLQNAENSRGLLENAFLDIRASLARMVTELELLELAEQRPAAEEQLLLGVSFSHSLRDFCQKEQRIGGALSFVGVYLENGICGTTAACNLPYDTYEELVTYLDSNDYLKKDAYRSMVWFDSVNLRDLSDAPKDMFLCVRFVFNRDMERVGLVVAGVAEEDLLDLFGVAFPGGMIVNQHGTVAVSGRSVRAETVSEEAMAVLRKLTYGNVRIEIPWEGKVTEALCWRVANNYAWFLIPLDGMDLIERSSIRNFLVSAILIVLSAVSLAVFCAVVFSRTLTNGIRKLHSVAQRVAAGERELRFVPKKHDEVAYLGLQFNDMLDRLQTHYRERQKHEEEKRNLELSLLQSRINPHLLYNTLDMVVWAIKSNKPDRAEQLVYQLSDFFKKSLAKGREYGTLEEELQLVESYVTLQRVAGGKAYTLQTHVPEALLQITLPHLLLQPLVENSVLHGFFGFCEDGVISIFAEQRADVLEIRVRDNGIGMSPDQAERLNRLFKSEAGEVEDKHYGLRNILRRIKNRYGEQSQMTVASEVGEFTEFTICIPYEHRKGEQTC